jgi:hypothetical protein
VHWGEPAGDRHRLAGAGDPGGAGAGEPGGTVDLQRGAAGGVPGQDPDPARVRGLAAHACARPVIPRTPVPEATPSPRTPAPVPAAVPTTPAPVPTPLPTTPAASGVPPPPNTPDPLETPSWLPKPATPAAVRLPCPLTPKPPFGPPEPDTPAPLPEPFPCTPAAPVAVTGRGERDLVAEPGQGLLVVADQVAVVAGVAAVVVVGAGDQLYIDLDLSVDSLPAGSLLAVGQAVLQVSGAPHLGCAKFVERFGAEAMRFVNSRVGRQLRLRGFNARVVQPGIVHPGDIATRPQVTARQP